MLFGAGGEEREGLDSERKTAGRNVQVGVTKTKPGKKGGWKETPSLQKSALRGRNTGAPAWKNCQSSSCPGFIAAAGSKRCVIFSEGLEARMKTSFPLNWGRPDKNLESKGP